MFATGGLLEAIKRDFGSFDDFKTQMSGKTVAIQGSGWGWLVSEGVRHTLEHYNGMCLFYRAMTRLGSNWSSQLVPTKTLYRPQQVKSAYTKIREQGKVMLCGRNQLSVLIAWCA